MKVLNMLFRIILIMTLFSCYSQSQTTALWLFDEPLGQYPSHVLDDFSKNDYPLVLGQGGKLVKGKFGNALQVADRTLKEYPNGEARFGLERLPVADGRTVEPMNWFNAKFCALMTSGEGHLRNEIGMVNATDTKLNLGDFDWTVEFWFTSNNKLSETGVVFELGQGPRAENDKKTALILNLSKSEFVLNNQPSKSSVVIKSSEKALQNGWHHFAFTYSSSSKSLKHFVDGNLISTSAKIAISELEHGDEDYLSIGRDGKWENPLPGVIDELRFSSSAIYRADFDIHRSFSPYYDESRKPVDLVKGLSLLFEKETIKPINLGTRKHLFLDDAFLEKVDTEANFVVNPPQKAERVIDNIKGSFRKHLTVVQDEEDLIRIFNSVEKDYLAVYTSKDGVNFDYPDVGNGIIEGHKNIVIPENVGGLGNPFIDPNGPPEERWKYFSDYNRRGIYLYTSADGYAWKRVPTSIIPFRSGTQSCTFYDEQRQEYVSYHRSGIFHTPAGATKRSSVVVSIKDFFKPVEFSPLDRDQYLDLDKEYPLRNPLPWYLDNGPLTPGGFGMEFEHKFDPIPADPVGTDFYITKAQKYPWAPDAYVAFPIAYFHYEMDGPDTRLVLMDPRRERGSGPLETQLEVSRDGYNWQRFADPAYVGIGHHQGRNVVTAYIAHGMVRRGDEIWQYYFGETQYHSAWKKDDAGRGVYRLVQRLDGFVSLDSPYDKEVEVRTKPFVFEGNRLKLNIDTDAVGYTQVGFLDDRGKPIAGFSVDECIYINGDFIRTQVEWIKNRDEYKDINAKSEDEFVELAKKIRSGNDVSELAGKTVQLVFRMRGSKLYAMQFLNN